MANTLLEIKNSVYSKMGQPVTSKTYDYTTLVKPKINSVISRICTNGIKDIIRSTANNEIIYRPGDLRFLRDKMFIKVPIPTATSTAINPGDTNINANTTSFAPSGYGIVNNNVFQYTGVTGSQFTGVTGLIVQSNPGVMVEQVFQIPATSSKVFQLFWLLQKNEVAEVPEFDSKFARPASMFYTILEDATTTNNFVYVHGQRLSQFPGFMLYFYNVPNVLVNDGDITILPDNAGIDFVSSIVAGELMWDKEEKSDGSDKLTLGYGQLLEFYDYWAKQTKKFRNKVQYKEIDNFYYFNFMTAHQRC